MSKAQNYTNINASTHHKALMRAAKATQKNCKKNKTPLRKLFKAFWHFFPIFPKNQNNIM